MNRLIARNSAWLLALAMAPTAWAAADCEAQAAEKKLAGAAKASFVKKCQSDAASPDAAAAACEKSAADKKLAGAAKNSHIKKCLEDASAAKAPPAKK